MARTLNRLTAREITALQKPGRVADGGGLYVRVAASGGGKSYIFLGAYKGKRVEIGLGSERSVSLKTARSQAAKLREAIALGHDPREALKADLPPPGAAVAPLFGDFTDAILVDILPGLKNEKHRQGWTNTLKTHAASLRPMRVDAITTNDVLAVLRPIWQIIPEQASRVRQRIERILGAAKAAGHRPIDSTNPAAWKDHLAHFLPSPKQAIHHAAVPWKEMPDFWGRLSTRTSTSAQCLRFLILTAARTGEVLGAMPKEFEDLEPRFEMKDGRRVRIDSPKWSVPGSRMKMKQPHEVPLSDAAAAIVREMSRGRGPDDRLFKLSGMAMLMLLRDMDRTETTHGFRSSFRDWAGEKTDYPRELAEMALAHAVGSAVEQSYRRGRAFEKRRPLMRDWADYLAGAPAPVTELEVNAPPAKEPRAPTLASAGNPQGASKGHPGQTALFDKV